MAQLCTLVHALCTHAHALRVHVYTMQQKFLDRNFGQKLIALIRMPSAASLALPPSRAKIRVHNALKRLRFRDKGKKRFGAVAGPNSQIWNFWGSCSTVLNLRRL